MDTAPTLIRIHLFICQRYRGRLAAVAQRQTGNAEPAFTDEEVMTIYVFGLIKKRKSTSEIHEYVLDHYSDRFPDLPSYQGYNRRLNRLSAIFSATGRLYLEAVSRTRQPIESLLNWTNEKTGIRRVSKGRSPGNPRARLQSARYRHATSRA